LLFAHENSRERLSARLPDEPSQEDLTTPREGQLWRRIPCNRQVIFDPKLGRKRPTTAAFDDWKDELGDPDPVSAYVATKCQRPIVALDGLPGFGLVMITKALVEDCGLKIVEKEQTGPPGHVLLVGAKTYKVRNRLATGAEWVVPCP